MTIGVTIASSPTTVTVVNDVIQVSVSNPVIQVSLTGIGPQGPPGPAGSGLAWNEVTTSSVTLAVDGGYLMNNASRVVGTLPAVAAQFSIIRICGKGAGGWKIAQNAGQTIHFDANDTTTGTAGYLASQSTFDCIDLLCITANTDFLVTSSIGNITGA